MSYSITILLDQYIVDKINRLRLRYPDYYNKNVDYNVVIKKSEGFKQICDFFDNAEFLKKNIVHFSFLDMIGIDSPPEIDEHFLSEYNYQYFLALAAKIGMISEDFVPKLMKEACKKVDELRGGKHNTGRREVPEKCHHGGPCIPGEKALFVNTDGDIYPCERVCEKSLFNVIGNVVDGIDIDRVRKVINIERLTKRQCQLCWAYEYCDVCARFIGSDESVTKSNILNHCDTLRKQVEECFKDYCVLRELCA